MTDDSTYSHSKLWATDGSTLSGNPHPDIELSYTSPIREKGVPDYLYKFRSWSSEYGRRLLTDQIVWFASPASFNDPFDCKIPYRFDKMSEKELFKKMYRLGKEKHPDWNHEKLRREITQHMKQNPLFSSKASEREQAMEKLWKSIRERFGILSFAGGFENILLWSHYSDSHRGFCVEIDGHLLADQLFDLHKIDKHNIDFYRVHYQESLPIVVPSNSSDEDRRPGAQQLAVGYVT